ncbi:hypothetical protein BJ944DRAFT_265147 [Cunninghamella echinulata]|nr:hypothetical protein BJ944DRAFT_265147 [Cunninghamella echinulata]
MVSPVVLVTGCTKGGIGYELCKKFSQEGCRVFATARNVDNMSGLEEYGCEKLALDVTKADSINQCVEKVLEAAGRIDILVNNAGTPAIGALLDIDFDTIRQCIETNVFGLLSISRIVGRHMAEKQKSGKIVNFGSVVGYSSTPWAGIYSLSKAAVHSLSDTLRMELKPFGVHVTVVAPGAITSNIGNASTNTINIPDNSLYKSVTKFIFARANLSQGPSSTPTAVFASKVVKKILRPTPPRYITEGTNSLTFLLFYYLPFFIKDYILSRKLGVNQIKLVKDN